MQGKLNFSSLALCLCGLSMACGLVCARPAAPMEAEIANLTAQLFPKMFTTNEEATLTPDETLGRLIELESLLGSSQDGAKVGAQLLVVEDLIAASTVNDLGCLNDYIERRKEAIESYGKQSANLEHYLVAQAKQQFGHCAAMIKQSEHVAKMSHSDRLDLRLLARTLEQAFGSDRRDPIRLIHNDRRVGEAIIAFMRLQGGLRERDPNEGRNFQKEFDQHLGRRCERLVRATLFEALHKNLGSRLLAQVDQDVLDLVEYYKNCQDVLHSSARAQKIYKSLVRDPFRT